LLQLESNVPAAQFAQLLTPRTHFDEASFLLRHGADNGTYLRDTTLAYLGLLFLVPLLAARQSKFAMFHCNQGLILFLASIVAWIGLAIVCFILAFIPVVGWILSMLLWLALVCGGLGLMILGIINAAKGVCKPLPLIGTLFTLVK